jgi:hypothetical protein
MSSAAIHSYGSTLAYCTTSGGSYTTVSEVIDLDEDAKVPGFKKTNLGSPSGTHEYGPKLVEPGELSSKGNYINTVYSTLYGFQVARTGLFWKATTPEGSVSFFPGFITTLKRTVPDDDGIKMDLGVLKSGAGTFTP